MLPTIAALQAEGAPVELRSVVLTPLKE